MNKTILDFINFLLKEKFLDNYKKFNNRILYEHLNQIDFLPKIVFNITYYITFISSIILYFKKFDNLNIIQKKKSIKIVKILFNPIFRKVEELIGALYLIHVNNNERLIKKNNFHNSKKFFKYIVIGSGPGGSITAYLLQKNLGNVLMIEEGEEYSIPNTKHPGDEFKKKWRDGGIKTTIFPGQINFSSGKCLGGGSEINSGLYHFPGKDFINGSRKLYKIKNFNYDLLKKLNKQILNISKISKSKNSISEKKFILGALKNNIKVDKISSLYWKSKKSSMLNTFIKKYKKINGKIRTNSKVDKIKRINNQWQIELLSKDNKKIILYSDFVFLCCGSIETQKILFKSKLFNNKILNFKLHPMVKALCKFQNKIIDKNENVHSSQIIKSNPKFILGEAASSEQFQLINFINKKDIFNKVKKYWRNISIIHSTFTFGYGKIIQIPFLKKFIYFYKIKNSNLTLIKSSLRTMCKTMFASGAKEIYLPFKNIYTLNSINYRTFINSIKNINEINFSAVHVLGGIKFGESNICEADSFGKIKKYDNLYINDSSLINFPLLKNPQGTVMIIAYRNILNFLDKIKNKK